MSPNRPEGGQATRHVDHHVQAAEVLERDLDRESGDVRLGQVAGAGPGVHTLGGKLPDPLGHTNRVQIAGNDLGSGLPERERHGVPDLARAAHAGHQHHLATKIESGSGHSDLQALENDVGARCAGLGVEHGSVAVDQADRARDSRQQRLERAVGAADGQVRDRTAAETAARASRRTPHGARPTPDSRRRAGCRGRCRSGSHRARRRVGGFSRVCCCRDKTPAAPATRRAAGEAGRFGRRTPRP